MGIVNVAVPFFAVIVLIFLGVNCGDISNTKRDYVSQIQRQNVPNSPTLNTPEWPELGQSSKRSGNLNPPAPLPTKVIFLPTTSRSPSSTSLQSTKPPSYAKASSQNIQPQSPQNELTIPTSQTANNPFSFSSTSPSSQQRPKPSTPHRSPPANSPQSWPKPPPNPQSFLRPVSVSGNVHNENQNHSTVIDDVQQKVNAVEDNELREFSENLLRKETNSALNTIRVNYQGQTTSRSLKDEAPLPLLEITNETLQIPTIERLRPLYDNYILNTKENEHVTAMERDEENKLIDAILSTQVMKFTRNFLISKGTIGKDPKEFKDYLKLIWFSMYSRGKGRIGSSGFEHIFLAEIRSDQVSGLHNWLYFYEEEKKGNADYLGYMRKIEFGNKGAILKYHFKFRNIDKPVGSMFIGTSPEFEMALYTTCFALRADRICPLQLDGKKFIIRTYKFRYRGKDTIGSAFPEI